MEEESKEQTEPVVEPVVESTAAVTSEEEDKRVSWNPQAILTTYEVNGEMIPYPKRVPRDPAVVKLRQDVLVNRVFREKPSRDIQVKRLEKRRGFPCEVRDELISAFNILAGLKKTVNLHDSFMKSFFEEKGYYDRADTEIRKELVLEYRDAREKAQRLMAQCGFKGMLDFGKILKDPHVSSHKQHKIKRLMDLLLLFT